MSIVVERRRSGARIAPLWKNRDYLRWFTGDLLGDLGSSLRGFAMPLVTLAVGGTATASGLIGTTGRIAYVVGLLPGGVIADRTDRKRLIVTGHVLRALVFGAVALAWWAGLLGIGGLVLAAVCSGAMSGLSAWPRTAPSSTSSPTSSCPPPPRPTRPGPVPSNSQPPPWPASS